MGTSKVGCKKSRNEMEPCYWLTVDAYFSSYIFFRWLPCLHSAIEQSDEL